MEDIEILKRISKRTRKELQNNYPYGGGGDVVGRGADGEYTKEIDREAERIILDQIEEIGVKWNILSEECGYLDNNSKKTLVVDPLDGTYNAVNGIPFYSISLALRGEEPNNLYCAVVMEVPTGRLFHAEKGKGAFVDAKPIFVRPYCPDTLVFSSFLGKPATSFNNRLLDIPSRGRYFGSVSLELCYVAMGSIDLFAVYKRIPRVTDLSAGYLILKEAGGNMLKFENNGYIQHMKPGDISETRIFLAIGGGSKEIWMERLHNCLKLEYGVKPL